MFPLSNTPTPTFPYRIEGKIGEGAMGVVYRAVEPMLNRKVAIKVLRMQMLEDEDPAIVDELRHIGEAFVHTAKVRAFLRHPGFPVDIRHNAKIGREKLATWAAQALERGA